MFIITTFSPKVKVIIVTLNEIRQSDKALLTPADIAPVLGCNPHQIRVTAHSRPELLGFPVCVVGNRTKIPRVHFIEFIEGRNNR